MLVLPDNKMSRDIMSLNLRYCSLSNKKLNLCSVSEWACAYCAKSGDGDACGYWGGGQNQNDIMSQWQWRWWGWQKWLWWCCWLGWWRRWWLWWCTGEGRKETIWRNGDRNKQSVGPWIPIKVNIIIMVVMMIMMVMVMVMIITMMMMVTMLSHHQRH